MFGYLPLEMGFKKKGLAVALYFWRGGAGFVKLGVWWYGGKLKGSGCSLGFFW